MNTAIRKRATERGITRLCHFTSARNFLHIAADPRGLLATRHLETDERAVFNPTDLNRFDGHPDHVCCSVQMPNAWYFRRARETDRNFPDWMVLLIAPHYLWMPETKFCPRNAAAHGGRDIESGYDAFEALFAQRAAGAYNQVFERTETRPDCLPTDEQAEVLIPDSVAREDLLGIVVKNESQAKREFERLRMLHNPAPRVLIGKDFFNPASLSATLRSGNFPTETEYYPGDKNV